MNRKKVITLTLKSVFVYAICAFFIVLFLVIGTLFITKKTKDDVLSYVRYTTNGGAGYRVFYKENDFYDEIFLGENKTYVNKYVNNVDIDFNYLVNFDTSLKGTYKYSITGTLITFIPGEENNDLWKKDYVLKSEEILKFNDKKSYSIHEKLTVDFQKYVSDFISYKTHSSINSSSKFVVSMNIDNLCDNNGLNTFDFNDSISVEIPVSDPTFNITKKSSIDSNEKVSKRVVSNKSDRIFSIVIGVLSYIIVIVLIVKCISRYIRDLKKQSDYNKTLKKILNTYSNVIVKVDQLTSIKDLSVAYVTSFEELIDAQNEIRLPINFHEDKKKRVAHFVIVRNNLAWVYILKDGEQDEKTEEE